MALVVQEAAEIIWSDFCKAESLTPKTIFLISPLAGAVNMTFDAPLDRCWDSESSSLQIPVLSITIGELIFKSE